MWGLRGRRRHHPAVATMFPTHVGIARRSDGRMDLAIDVPYACGDCAEAVNNLYKGSYMFPTHVGIARPSTGPAGGTGNVPYACGDCATPSCTKRIAQVCSLRMWGLRVPAASPDAELTMFPTHVGIARPSTGPAGGTGNVPYACGDCATPSCTKRIAQVCSLRMWGLRVPAASPDAELTMFPTHVGIARRRAGRRVHGFDVPYACGDCAEPSMARRRRNACSLRMWGLRGTLGAGQEHLGMFPTHVGIARRPGRPGPADFHVPYACGDCADGSEDLRRFQRCSLRMWGLRERVRQAADCGRMFPTHVGIARIAGRSKRTLRHVPYACGDCAAAALTAPVPGVMFPTHVGIARPYCLRWRTPSDVPYACGDCASGTASMTGASLCSLRMWGLRGIRVLGVHQRRMFPTHVGIAR